MEENERKKIMVVLFLGVLMGALDMSIVGPALPAIKLFFHESMRSVSWTYSIFGLFTILGTPLMSKLSDKHGRKNIYIINLILFGSGSLIVVFSSVVYNYVKISMPFSSLGFITLLIGRAIQGFGAGGIFPVASAVIGDVFPPEKRGSALGTIGAVFGVAFILGPTLGGTLLYFGWQWLFLINIPLIILIIFLGRKNLPNKPRDFQAPFDRKGLLITFVLFSTLAIGINEIDESNILKSFSSLNVLIFLITAIIFIPLLVYAEHRAKDPVINLQLIENKQLRNVNLISLGSGMIQSTMIYLPTLAVIAFGFTESIASFIIIPAVAATGLSAPLIGRLVDRIGPKRIIVVGSILGFTGFLITGNFGAQFPFFMFGIVLIGIGQAGLVGSPLRYIVLKEAPPAERASFQGFMTIFSRIGQLLGGVLLGGIITSLGGGLFGFKVAYILIACIEIILFLLSLKIRSYSEKIIK